MYLHEQDDIAMVKDLGFAVSPGVHSLVSAKYSKVIMMMMMMMMKVSWHLISP